MSRWMKFILALVFCLGAAAPASASVCWVQDRDEFAAQLLAHEGQLPIFIGVESAASSAHVLWVFEVHAAPGGKSWIAFTWAGETGQICLVGRGRRWSIDKES